MSQPRGAWWVGRWGLLLAPFIALSTIGQTARGQGQGETKGKPAPTAAEKAEAAEILRALRELAASVEMEAMPKKAAVADKEDPKAKPKPKVKPSAPAAKMPPRPARTVAPPTLDAEGVDALIDRSLSTSKVAPARLTGDEEFVRRICLDVAGKLPTPVQVVAFCQDKDKHKREKLIDLLLASPDHARNWARYWRDVVKFHSTNDNLNQVRWPALEEWLFDQFRKNRPWDEIARELIAATGRNDENGATVFTIAQMGQPVELAGEVSRVFLGVQIQCAQCHDHPNDPWKREQFHELAAFFAGTQIRRHAPPKPAAVEKDTAKDATAKDKAKPKAQALGQPAFEVVAQAKSPRYKMPDLKDPHKEIAVEPKFFLAASSEPVPPGLSAEQRRTLVASYVTGQDNPWFARAYVNRVWALLMGEGFYNPVDDLGPTRTPLAPEVIDALAAQFQQGGYDVRWLFRTILNTKAYQREFRPANSASGKTPFAANTPSRLRADQILDALAQAINLPLEPGGGAGRKGKADDQGTMVKNIMAMIARARNGVRFQFNATFGVDPSTPTDDILGTIPQALFMMNSPAINKAIEARPGTVLGDILAAHADNRSALDALYLRVLARHPTKPEIRVIDRYMLTVGDRRELFEDILWSLVNSTEFVSRR